MLGRILVPLCIGMLSAAALTAQEKPKSSSKLITAEEIERVSVSNAFEAVQLLRPRWLRQTEVLGLPGTPSADMQMQQIHVYINDRDRGTLDFLKTIPSETVFTMRFMSMTEVGAMFGPSSGPGIVVTLKN